MIVHWPHPIRRRRALVAACLFIACAVIGAQPATAAVVRGKPAATSPSQTSRVEQPSYTSRAEVRGFIDEMAALGFDRRDLNAWLAAAKFQPRIVAAMQRPILEPPKWFEYAPPFLSPERIAGGVAFWQVHADALARAERDYGVPPEIVVAIVGVETYYGRNTGSYRVIDALATLAFDYPRRASYFRGELREFLLLAREQRISPLLPKGSFAGALGVPQFMPGSVRKYAVDFDGDGSIDLWSSVDDTIGSVANYLARHDWVRGQPVLLPAVIASSERAGVLQKLDGGISERRPLAAWSLDGVTAGAVPDDLAPDPLGLLMLEERPAAAGAPSDADASYWIACPNFYVITRYNKSRLYAAAVWSLATRVRDAHEASAGATPKAFSPRDGSKIGATTADPRPIAAPPTVESARSSAASPATAPSSIPETIPPAPAANAPAASAPAPASPAVEPSTPPDSPAQTAPSAQLPKEAPAPPAK